MDVEISLYSCRLCSASNLSESELIAIDDEMEKRINFLIGIEVKF